MQVFLVLAAILAPALSARIPHIVGGSDVEVPGTYPWQASQQRFGSHVCGLALISDKWLVTAAHCVGSSSSLSFVLGMHDRIRQRKGEPTRFKVDKIIQLPDWENNGRKAFSNDIAVVRISGKADLSSPYISAVPMAARGADFVGSDCVITGWGKTSGGIFGRIPDILQMAPVDVYTHEYCQRQFLLAPITASHICVGDKGNAGACFGDSGGPLTCHDANDEMVLAGVTSFGKGWCTTRAPSVYSRISYYRDWISQQTGLL